MIRQTPENILARMKIIEKTIADLKRKPKVDMYRIERFSLILDSLAEDLQTMGKGIIK